MKRLCFLWKDTSLQMVAIGDSFMTFSSHDTLGLHCLGCHMLSHCLGSVTGLNLSQLSASDPVGRLCTWVRGTGPTAPCAARWPWAASGLPRMWFMWLWYSCLEFALICCSDRRWQDLWGVWWPPMDKDILRSDTQNLRPSMAFRAMTCSLASMVPGLTDIHHEYDWSAYDSISIYNDCNAAMPYNASFAVVFHEKYWHCHWITQDRKFTVITGDLGCLQNPSEFFNQFLHIASFCRL